MPTEKRTIVKRIMECECGEEFEADITDSGLKENILVKGPWRYVKSYGMGNDDDESVKIIFSRGIECRRCFAQKTEEKVVYVKLTAEKEIEYAVEG